MAQNLIEKIAQSFAAGGMLLPIFDRDKHEAWIINRNFAPIVGFTPKQVWECHPGFILIENNALDYYFIGGWQPQIDLGLSYG